MERGEMWHGEDLMRLTATEVPADANLLRPVRRAVAACNWSRIWAVIGGQAQERAVDVQITRLRRKIEM